MGVELISDKDPLALGIGRHRLANVCDKILFSAGIADRGTNHLTGRDLEIGDQRLGSMPDLFELDGLGAAWPHRAGWVEPLQRLNPGFFINTDQMNPRLMEFFRLMIEFTDRAYLLPEGGLIVDLMVQPILGTMRLQIRLILKNDRWSWWISFRRSGAEPRRGPVPGGSNGSGARGAFHRLTR